MCISPNQDSSFIPSFVALRNYFASTMVLPIPCLQFSPFGCFYFADHQVIYIYIYIYIYSELHMEAQEGYTCGFISSSSSLYIKVPRFQHGLNFQLQLCWDAQGLPLAGWATRDEARDRVLQGPPKEPRPSLFCLCLRLMSLQNQISRHCSQPDACQARQLDTRMATQKMMPPSWLGVVGIEHVFVQSLFSIIFFFFYLARLAYKKITHKYAHLQGSHHWYDSIPD